MNSGTSLAAGSRESWRICPDSLFAIADSHRLASSTGPGHDQRTRECSAAACSASGEPHSWCSGDVAESYVQEVAR